jgi:hypothetical protein
MAGDLDAANGFLERLAERIERDSSVEQAEVRFSRDGSLEVRLAWRGRRVRVEWRARADETVAEAALPRENGVVCAPRSEAPIDRREQAELHALCTHVALQIEHLARTGPAHLLTWRNREFQKIHWGMRMLHRLCPGALSPGRTRYFDYRLTGLDEYEGLVRLRFESRQRTVVLRLSPTDATPPDALTSWGPIALSVAEDDRTDTERADRSHQVEEFVGYLLSRNLPAAFELAFERGDPPLGHLPEDFGVDLLNLVPPDDTSWFYMIFASASDVAIVTCCDRECFNLFSFVTAPPEGWAAAAPWKLHPSADLLRHLYQVGVAGDAALMGSQRAERCLDGIAHSARPPELIVLIDSCLSRMLGEDLDGVVRHFGSSSQIPIVLYDVKLVQEPYLGQLDDFWRNLYRAVRKGEPSGAKRRLGLFGVDLPADLRDLVDRLGLTIASDLFPGFSARSVRALGSCSLIVRNRWHCVPAMTKSLMVELGAPTLDLPLPYGWRGSQQWLDQVSRATGAGGLDELSWPEEVLQAKDTFEQLVDQIRGARIGVVSRLSSVRAELSVEQRYGIDLVGVLHELGLSIDLNLYAADGEAELEDRLFDEVGLRPDLGDSVSTFAHRTELVPLLAEGDFQLAYTEQYRDARVVSAGKTPLGLGDLQPGFVGAMHNARMVLAKSKSRFFARYGRYCSDPYAHRLEASEQP